MSRVLLISSNTAVDPYPVYPLGMAVVAGALQATGHQVQQYDCLAFGEDSLAERLAEFAPDLISISLRNIDNVDSLSGESGWYLQRTRTLVEKLRSLSRAPIVVGGPALTIMPELIAEYLAVDHAIIGEGERALPQLVADLAAGKQPPQLIQRGQALCGNDFSTPLYDAALIPFYLEQSGMLNLQTKRGCPYACLYCSYPHLEGNQFRVRDAQLVVEEMLRLKQEHGVDKLFFTDSVFNDPQGDYLVLVEEILRRDPGIKWSAFFRPQGFGRSELALMKRAGLYALELGTDAASNQTLKGLNKNLTIEEVFAVNQACIDERLPAAHFVMFGGPDEDEASVSEGLANLHLLGPSVVFAFSGIRIFPDSPLQRRALAEGVIAAATSLLKPVHYFSPQIDHVRMEAQIKESFARHGHMIFPPSEGQERIKVMQSFGFRGMMWDYLVRFPKGEK